MSRRWRCALPRWWWLIAFACLYTVPYYPKIQSANELPRAYLVKALVDHGRLWIDDGVTRWGSTADVSPWQGHSYSNKAPGSSLLTAPAYAAVKLLTRAEPSLAVTIWLGRVTTGILPTLLLLLLLYHFLARYQISPAARQLTVVAYALGSMAMPYSILFIAHQPSAVAVAVTWMAAQWVADRSPTGTPPGNAPSTSRRRLLLMMLVAGGAAGWAPLLDYQAAFALPPLAALLLSKLWRRADRAELLAVAAAGAALPIAVLLGYHALAFGSPWRTGYQASVTFASFHQHGLLGITELRWHAFWSSMVGLDTGLLTFSPWLALAVPGSVLLWRRGARADAATFAGIAILYVLFLSSINFWRGGWQVGPRYITVMLPFLLPAVAVAIDSVVADHGSLDGARLGERWRRGLGQVLVVAMCAIGVVVYAGTAAQFPYFPERFANPVHELTLRLWAEGLAAPTPLGWLGVPGPWSLAPYLLAVIVATGLAARGIATSWARVAIAIAITALVFTATRGLGRGGEQNEASYQWVRSVMTHDPLP